MILRISLLIVAVATTVSFAVAAPVPPDRRVLHHCEDVLTQAATLANSKASPDTAEVARCRIVVREFALRDSRMSVDENGKMMR